MIIPKRLLIVEDDPDREARIRSWVPTDFRVVVTASAGAAIGLLRLDRGRVYVGIVLDHDLQARRASESDRHLSGADVAVAIEDYIDRSVPILIHSMNVTQRGPMAASLRRAGFAVTVIPMEALTQDGFLGWLDETRVGLDDGEQ